MNLRNIYRPMMLLAAAMIWGFAFAAQDAASDVPAFTLGATRSVFAAIFLFILIPVLDLIGKSERRLVSKKGIDFTRGELIGGVITGVILASATAFQQFGINMGTDGGKAAFITALYVVLVPIYALALKKKSGINVWISIFIAAIGFYLLCIKDNFSIQPSDLVVMGGALIFPIHILTIDHYSTRCDGVRMSCIQFLTCAIVNTVLALIFETPISLGVIGENILPLLFLGIVSSGIAYTLQILGQKGTDPTVASIILSLESVFGVIGTAIFLGQSLTLREYIGCGIVLVAVILSQIDLSGLSRGEKKENGEPPLRSNSKQYFA